MKKINQARLFGIFASIMAGIGFIFPYFNSSIVWFAITELLYAVMITRLLIPSREEKLKKMHRKNWIVKHNST